MSEDRENYPLFASGVKGLAVLSGLQLAVGAFLAASYRPTIEDAHASTQALRQAGLSGFFTGFHYWGSAVSIALSGVLIAGMLWAGWYKPPRVGLWLGVLLIGAASLGLQITGNLLPMDRHDAQTAVIEAGIAARTPLVGDLVASLMLQGGVFGEWTLRAWYGAHLWLFTPMLVLGSLWVLPRVWDLRGAKWAFLAPSVVTAVLSLGLVAPYGPAATAADFVAQEAVVSWYVWPMHGALRAFEAISPELGWIGSAALPGVFFFFLATLPWTGRAMSENAVREVFSAFVVVFVICAGAFGGTPAPIWGEQDIPSAEPRTTADQPGGPVNAALARKGNALFNRLPCMGCHGSDGTGTRSGPSLRNVHQRHSSPDWYIRFIRNPKAVKPNTVMPSFGDLSNEELAALAEWLRSPK